MQILWLGSWRDAIGAENLVLLTDVAGIVEDRDDPGSLVKEIDIKRMREMINKGKIAGGMIPKVTCSFMSLSRGVQELKHVLAMLDDFSPEQLGSKIKEYRIVAYMQPDTMQSIFVNFKDLYYHDGSKLPFAAPQIGQAFRNEACQMQISPQISPRQGLSRVPGFTLAEIEHFVDPEDKSHPKYSKVVDVELTGKDDIKLRLGNCEQRISWLLHWEDTSVISKEHLRFRQQPANENAHYADCWMLRLSAPMEKSGTPLVAHEKFSALKEVEKLVITPVKKELGLAFKGNQKKIVETLESLHTICDRIIYCFFDRSFYTDRKGDEQLNVFSNFPPCCSSHQLAVAKQISNDLFAAGICHRIGITGTSIGKEYARIDELVTILERDSKGQIGVEIGGGICSAEDVTDGIRTWEDNRWKYPSHSSMSPADGKATLESAVSAVKVQMLLSDTSGKLPWKVMGKC
ncbi:hypothetical protein MKX03_000076 [Papaver bracteatum]|nr:hypothetical protein MKX03_000076 [Papaver bracteatum]